MTTAERERVIQALHKFGYQSQSYNVLSGQMSYFFSERGTDGVIAYVVVAGVALVAGDPLCGDADIRSFCAEFLNFCDQKGYRCAFQAVTDRTLAHLQYLKFGYIKIGEEPFFRLAEFSLAGGDFKDLRRDIRRSQADGMSVIEYRPNEERDPDLESQMTALSDEWKQDKGSTEFGFLVGRPSLEDPGGRKYFLAMLDGQVEAFCVCTPIEARNGIYFDLLRRKKRPNRGTVELLVTESFSQLKDQGFDLATLGTAPLSGEHADDLAQGWFIEIAMDIAFGRLGYFYSFKPLYQFKRQFGPHFWESRFLAYHPDRFRPVVIFALLNAYDPDAVRNLSQKQLAATWSGVTKLAGLPVDIARWSADVPSDIASRVVRVASSVSKTRSIGYPRLPELPGIAALRVAPQRINRLIRPPSLDEVE